MTTELHVQHGTIRPKLVAELEAFRAPGQRVSSYYLDLDPEKWGGTKAVHVAAKNERNKYRKQIDQLDAPPAVKHALRRDWEEVSELASSAVGEQHTRGMACFVASESRYARDVRLPWQIRDRAFFEDRFVLWPLRQLLEQVDRFAICLTDKAEARLFLFYLEQIEEVNDVLDEVPGRIRFPDPFGERHYMNKHVQHFHRHFVRTGEAALRLFESEPFEHLIIGGTWETLPQFESYLHRYLRDRIVARWDIDLHTPMDQILQRARQEEDALRQRQAQNIWQQIHELPPERRAIGPEEVFAVLWQQRVESLLAYPGSKWPGFRCSTCSRLREIGGPCVECGHPTTEVPDVIEEAVQVAVEQSAQVYFWKDPALQNSKSLAALTRY